MMPRYATTLGSRIRCRRLPPTPMIKSNCNGDNNISWYSLFDAKNNAARRTTATRRRWQPQRCILLHQSFFNAKYNKNTKLLQQVYHLSTSTNCNSDVKECVTPKLISIHDHLNELHDIPLEDVRNFCIIAHVVRSCQLFVCIVISYSMFM